MSFFHQQELGVTAKRLGKYIVEGQLQEKEALDNVKDLMGCLRDANATIRWIMLHQNATEEKMKQMVDSIVKED